jgi:hypothetical protein
MEKFYQPSESDSDCGYAASEVRLREYPDVLRCVEEQKRSEILNQKMRKLVQKLGEAIHASVSESEYIASVVQDIRKQGFDVLLMLEATIGLNEVAEQQPAAAKKSSKTAGAEEMEEDQTFTVQDLHFLKSLRIAIEGEEDDASPDE